MHRFLRIIAAAALLGAGSQSASGCSCERGTLREGFERAQYVFAGTVVEGGVHTWQVEVERVWKGADKLARRIRLMDVYASMDCEFFFEQGRRYIFFAIRAKSGADVFYHPQVCNWTSPLQSTRVGDGSLWLEDLVSREYGPGEPPRRKPPR